MAGRRAPDKLSQGLQDTLPKEGNVDSIPRNNSGLSAPVDLTTLTTMINAHLKNHQARSTEECQALMGSVEANLEGLMDKHFSVNAEPSRVSEMLLFHIMFSGQQYLECEYAHLVFGEGETRSVSYPIWKLCALLPLPRFAGLQDRLVAHVLLLASHWLPRDTAVLIGFFEDVVELLQNLEELWRIAEERGEDAVFVAGTRVVAFPRLGEGLVRGPLDIELPSRHNLFLCRASLTTIASKLGTLTPGTFTGTYAYAALWCTLGRQLNVALRPDTEALHKVSLEALVTLLDEVPPGGCMPRLGIDCLRLAGRVLVVRAERGEVDEEDERSVKHATLRGKLERVATIQDLLAKCLRLMFRESHSSLTATVGAELCPNRRLSVVAAAGGWSSLSGALICVAEWWSAHSHKKISESDKAHSPWQPLSPAMGIEDGVEALRSLEAVSLARAVAGAYASAVEQSEFIRSTRAPTTAPTGQASAHPLEKTLRAAGERITIAPNLELTPRFDKGLPSQSAASSAAIAASLPRRFATAVSAMSSMPCVQPELVRVLRAVVDRLPPTPFVSAMSRRRLRRNQSGDELATSTNQGPGVHQSSMETSHQCERAKRDMAPPLPRETMGKKRRIVSTSISANSTNSAVDTGGLRAAASGSAGEDGSERNAVENAGRKQPPTAERSDANGLQHYRHQERVTTMTDSRSGSERAAPREWPPVFSVQPGLQEALDVVVLSRARAGLEFFEALDGAGDAVADRGGDGGDGNCNSGNDMDCGGIISGEAVDSERLRSSTRRLSMLLQHTAAITCGLRVLAPLTEAGRFSALPHGDGARGRRLDFGVGGGRKRTTLEMAALDVRLDQQDGAGNLEPSVLETDHTNVSRIVCGLAGGFATAVRAVARYKPGSSIPSRDSRTKVVREDGNSSSLSAATSRAVALLWDMLLNCAAELPIGLHAALAQSGVDESSRSDTAEQLSARILLVNTVGDVAEKSLEVVLDSNSAVLDAALALEAQNTIAHSRGGTDPMGSRGSSLWVPRLVAPRDGGGNDEEGVLRGSGVGATTTVLGPMATSAAPLPLKCFLLAAAVANGWGREQDRGEGGLSTVDKEDGGRRNPRSRDSQAGRGKEEGEYSIEAVARRNPQDVDSSGEKLSGDEGGVNVGRRFAAAEAFLAGLRCGRRTIVAQSAVAALPCLSLCTCRRGRDVDSPSEHAGSCDWPTKWLPALLTLLEGTDGHGGGVSESVRLELAASLPRLGESLLQSQTDFSTAADANVASDAADDISASLQPRRKQALETRGDPGSVVSGDEAKASPNGFEDLLPLWPRLLQDESPVVRGVSARAALSAASAAPLPRLMSSGTAGARVLELLVGMLACGDPEVAWVVSGGAGQFVADGGKLLRALYGPSSTSSSLGVGVPTEASGSGAEEGRGGENDDGDEDTLGEEEEEERREERLREKALSRFIEAVGAKLQEHGDRLRRDRWQSLNEFTALLRALASIGCESDPTDNLGRSVYLWTLIRLVDVWVDEGNDCGPAAHEQIVRVCGHGKVPLTRLFRLPPPPSSTSSAGNSRGRGAGTRKAETDDELKAAVAFGEGLDSGGVLAPLMEKLMETGHVEEFVEQALGSPNFRAFLADSVARVLPIFVAGSKAVAVEKLAALCDRFEVGDARGKDPPQRLLNRHLPHVLTDVLMRGRSAWTDEKSSPGLQFLLKYFPESTPKRLIEGVLPQILEQVSWQLCGPRREEATVALQAVAHISYRHHDNAGAAAAAAAAANDVVSMDRKVEAMVTRHFLFLMSNVVSKRWSSRTTKDKIRAIQVLGRLVGFLSEDEGGGLFPKVMATLQSALADPHGTPAQRRAAYRVMMGYILGLSDASLAENLSTIVVNVLALIEEVGSDDGAEEITISGGGGGDGSRQILNNNSLLYVTSPPPKNSNTLPVAAAAAGARDGNVSHSLLLERAAAYSREGTGAPSPGVSSLSRRSDKGMEGLGSEAAEIRATAAALLRRLVVDKQDCLRGHFHKIPFMPQIPDLPALAEIGAVLSAELGYQSLREQLGRLTPLLGDESAEVRRAALKHLALVLRRDKQGLAELILEGREVDSVVSRLLRGLLELSTDSDARIRDVCGLCLGEVGAVDPSRVGLRLRDGATSDGGVPGGSGQALLDAAPWEVTVEEMSLLLIKNFLVPAFRASTTSMEQDRVAFGIQELLHILSVSFVKNAGDEDAASGLTQNLGNEHGDGRVPSGVGGGGGSVGPMPERLARRLREAQVLAVVEPFWRSTYKLSDRAPSSREAFFCDRAMTVSLERWLSSWCRYLISRARGPLRPAFEACRGAVRAHAPMAQYLLNHLVADVLAFGDREAVDQVLAEVLAVMRVASPASSSSSSFASTAEFQLARAAVPRAGGEGSFSSSRPKQRGRGGQNGSSRSSSSNSGIEHIATQAAFRLLDRLGHWSAGRGRRHGGAGVAGGVGWPDDATRRAALLDFVRRVPRGALVRASMRVRAYTRALRYLEEQIRAEHAARRSANGRSGANLLAQVGAFRNDGANGTLPVLNPAELHQLQAIYRTLSDEPDGMVGLEVMRGAAGVPATLKQRTWQHEHAEDWTGALEMFGLAFPTIREASEAGKVYEQALQERELLNVRGRYLEGRDGVVPSPAAAAAADGVLRDRTDPMQDRYDQMAALPPPAAGSKADSPAQYHHRQQPSTKGVGDEGEEVKEDFEGDEWEEGEVERGMLHGLVELGHLEMLLHQASGMLGVASKQHLAPLLLPVAVEAAWRLQRWPLLQDLLHQQNSIGTEEHNLISQGGRGLSGVRSPSPSFAADELSGESRYRLALGKVMLRLEQAQPAPFASAVAEARADVMAGLGAASMESYQRAYPFLLKLHSIREAEQAFEVMQQRGRDPAAREKGLLDLGWDARLSAMAASLRQLAPVLAVRRAAFELCSLEGPQADNWLCLAKRARAAGQFAVAGAALRRAGRLGVCQERLAFEEAKLARERDGVHRALVMLEPVETDVDSLRALISLDPASTRRSSKRSGNASPGKILEEDERMQLARKLLLTTEWIVEAGQKHGEAVVARYKLALQLRPGWEKGYFCLGQYIDLLFKSRVEELQRHKQKGGGSSRQQRGARSRGWEGDELAHRLALQTMDNYARSLRYGAKYIFQSMPRLLTLWFQVGFLRDSGAGEGQSSVSSRSLRNSNGKGRRRHHQAAQIPAKSAIRKLQEGSTKLVKNAVRSIPPYMWYTALPQLTSRVGHPNVEVLKVIIEALAMLLKAHPKQAMWHLSTLCMSISAARKQVGNEVFEQARRMLVGDGRAEDAVAVQDGQKLFAELRNLAEEQPPKNLKEASFKIGHRMDLHRFIVPVQAGLTVSLPQAPRKDTWCGAGGIPSGRAKEVDSDVPMSQAEALAAASVAAHNPFPGAEMHIKCFNNRVRYMASKAKPKRVSLRTLETGETVYFLCKQERNGDLRKDARLMEFNGMINRLLQKDPAGRARKLRLRTYAVICLNEECGVLEWVQDTCGFRQLVHAANQIKNRGSSPTKPPSLGQIKTILDRVQMVASQENGLQRAVQMYREHILPNQEPCFHLWFVDHFAEPTAWFEARTTFARSAGVWSSVGHVVGLGDRHGENLLIHTESGECVHVDFDCLFDKGLTLARPEIVPFRLTPSMVDGMGLCGFEGVYRRAMEACISVLRTNRETLLSVLEPFLQDPTVGWSRSGRAQRSTHGNGEDLSDDGDEGRDDLGREIENEDADRVLRVISERLQGRYNLAVPRAGGRGVTDVGNDLPLSVQGQVHRLITEASSHENLCQMYVGWMPWM